MNRTLTSQEPTNESFSGLLQRLSRSGVSEGDRLSSEWEPEGSLDFEMGMDTYSGSHSDTAAHRAATQRGGKVRSGKSRSDAGILSYEQALRMHSRRRSAERDSDPAESVAKMQQQAQKDDARHLEIREKSAVRAIPQPEIQTGPAVPLASKIRAAKRKSAAGSAASTQRPAPHSKRRVASNHRKELSGKPVEARIDRQSPGQALAAALLHERSLQLSQRKSVVSVRLNGQELDRLRLRAAESGLPVSAYMRACVLEAEHLRAQVKQALAEMRAYTGQPNPLQAEPAMLASYSETEKPASGVERSGSRIWSRTLVRSMALFFGSWFASRHPNG